MSGPENCPGAEKSYITLMLVATTAISTTSSSAYSNFNKKKSVFLKQYILANKISSATQWLYNCFYTFDFLALDSLEHGTHAV
jgi:hypothetical protein